MTKTFHQVENAFSELKRQFRQKLISEQEFKARLKELRLNDDQGRCWTIGARSGKWYYFDGEKWIEAQPPTLQDGKAICIYCGYENNIEADVCEYCSGEIGENASKCPECGFILESQHNVCPVCHDRNHGEEFNRTDELQDPPEKKHTPPLPKISKASWEHLKEWNDEEAPPSPRSSNKASLEHPAVPNVFIRSLSPMSTALFFGITGLFIGLIGGAFSGTTRLIPGLLDHLPAFYQSMHGKLTGGIIFGLTGGLAGLVVIGLAGLLYALFINIILSILGGLKVRVNKIDSF
ncbi:MAG: hypothetical protein R6V02_03155 [Candidatus Aminicenantes bacterium]